MVAVTMTATTANTEEPILSRLDRLDIMLRQLEEINGCNPIHQSSHSAKSSWESTPSSGTLTSDYAQVSSTTSADYFSPKSLEKHCRPFQNVMMETDAKGTLIERLDHVEDRVLKLCMQLEEELEAAERKREDRDRVKVETEVKVVEEKRTPHKKKGFKQLVKQCVTGKTN
ncbi:hypothetical protein RchiOBHm_Chr1g0316061 [Rosa chinensis]|uniref:Uncharacterized protein n=1 Tax=Rosa chinensis TaxID=74649 RepID=A0A2P6S7J0_ROSCH|nr:uncharacterized protein LOC112177949 [Rosa chinensis]PRQ54652.1 hypothetical protein RchiOBHm_Chr1g0316061 [Rosa chinensis]